jgi:hypothetical protein
MSLTVRPCRWASLTISLSSMSCSRTWRRVHDLRIRLRLRARQQEVELLLDVALEDRLLVHDRCDPVDALRAARRGGGRDQEGGQRHPSQVLQRHDLHG